MKIPSVVQGIVETENGKVFELNSPKGSAWLESIGSFRFEPSGESKPYTVRRESGIYWYGCRKIAGKVRKKYIGKSSDVTIAKLEEIAEALEIPPAPRVNKVAEVTQKVTQKVVQEVTQEVVQVAEGVVQDRLTALELQVANLQKAVEALQEALPGKLEVGNYLDLPKVDNKVAERLKNGLGNLKNENERLQTDYAALLESSTAVTKKLEREVQELRSQLQTEKTRGEEIWEELSDTEQTLAEVRSENSELKKTCNELRSDLNQESATVSKLPEAADLLNQLKGRRKKSRADLPDIEVILELLNQAGSSL